jgi:hypothetical protein
MLKDANMERASYSLRYGSKFSGGTGKGKVKVKLSLCLTKHHAMKAYWESGDIVPRIL